MKKDREMREKEWGRKIMGEGRVERVHWWVGLAEEFCSETIPRNRLGMVSVIPQKKVLIPRFTEESAQNKTE
jgi:hypothetical protein